MAETKSLKAYILERLELQQGGKKAASANIRKASHDFEKSNAPQFRGKTKAKRHQMAVAAGLSAARGESAAHKEGDKAIYEGKNVVIRSISESGMAVVRFGNNREVIVRSHDLKPVAKEQLNEGILGIAAIGPTYREPTNYGFLKLEGLDPEDIGLIYEDDKDEQEEDTDNGSNVRSDGHTGKKEVDELPTPSDTIAPAYTSDKPPKEISEPLSTHVGAQEEHLWDEPEWDGYDYPADAPEIPTADFLGSEMGNSRAPSFNDDEHQPMDGREDNDGDDDGVKESDDEDEDEDDTKDKIGEGQVSDPARKKGNKILAKMRKDLEFNENFFMAEMDSLLGPGEDVEPKSGDTITVTLPAMAAILCTAVHKGQDPNLLKAIVEALAEVSKGKTIDVGDLEAVAAHINGEEMPEIENREAGRPDHEGIGGEEGEEGPEEDHKGSDWPGDMEKTKSGKTKLMGGEYFGESDVMEGSQLSDSEELRVMLRRAGLKFW
jgi:hypothetical protein